MGGKEVGGGGKWRGGWELRGEGGGAMQEGREHAKKGFVFIGFYYWKQ